MLISYLTSNQEHVKKDKSDFTAASCVERQKCDDKSISMGFLKKFIITYLPATYISLY